MATWKRDFASGLIVLVPLIVTAIFLAWIYSYLTQIPIPIESGPARVALSLLIFVLLVFSVGYLMRTAVGSVLETALDDLMNSLPGLRVIYNASKMAVETALSGAEELQEPVRLEIWEGIRMTAFKTGNFAPDGREILFVPTAPNITSGYVIEVEPERYTEVDDSVEEALIRLLSAGFGDSEDDSFNSVKQTIGGSSDEVSANEISEVVTDGDGDSSPSSSGAADD
jgi:uncharacterized membrane protein